mmetsp:Transcript_6627/g.20149  ORF Transcript_6627/g.20149 Transcript_6627/m.20149 type:complete len:128 (-) Transcript_6627:18-401(-)
MSEYICRYRFSKMFSTCVDPGVYATAPKGKIGSTIVPGAFDGLTFRPRAGFNGGSHRISGNESSPNSGSGDDDGSSGDDELDADLDTGTSRRRPPRSCVGLVDWNASSEARPARPTASTETPRIAGC